MKKDEKKTKVKVSSSKTKTEELVLEIAKKLLFLMGAKAQVLVEKDEINDVLKVTISSEEEQGLLIGNRGETLNSIQAIIGMIVRNQTGEWKRIIVDIGDWRRRQEDYLESLALQAAQRARDTQQEQYLYNLDSSQRRMVHLALSDKKDVTTESVGEGENRYLMIKLLKNKK